MEQAAPERFTGVSLTGSKCALQCDHCKSSVLEGMRAIPPGRSLFELARALAARGTRGLLVSGGMSVDGRVPHLEHLESIVRVKRELGQKVIVHTGLVDRDAARAMKEAGIDGAFIDVIGADRTIHEVYHLKKKSVADFESSLAALCEAGLTAVPHIVLGLHYGKMLGEENALEIVARYPVSALILVVLMPILSTPMRGALPPPAEEVGEFFARARLRLPSTPVYLGCARPGGAHKQKTDRFAVDMGLNGIAYPAEGVVAYARDRGLEPAFHEACCSIHDV
ncbi:MAG: radical SAM protein [Deltaproteobacteria bacterium]|nr:radical SAM protein [Deltaproteobacteria bacterium]